MIPEKLQELSVLLLIEQLYNTNELFKKYFYTNCDSNKFNNRYNELLDEFLNDYALNTPEKSALN